MYRICKDSAINKRNFSMIVFPASDGNRHVLRKTLPLMAPTPGAYIAALEVNQFFKEFIGCTFKYKIICTDIKHSSMLCSSLLEDYIWLNAQVISS